jgi:fibronectin-binding autotransporter adhesin
MALTRPRAYQIYDIDYKQATRVVTTTNITLSGGAPNTVDSISLAANDRVLVTGQTLGAQNGIYIVSTLGTGSNGTWTRSTDTDTTGELLAGTIVMVTEGAVYQDTQWKLTTDDPITIGTTALTFVQNYSANSISAGTSNVTVVSNGNVNVSSGGTPNVFVVSSTGTVTSGTANITGNVSAAGNVTGSYLLGNVFFATGITANKIYNGTSEVAIGSSGGNANISIGGTSNVVVVSTDGVSVTGNLTVTGNATLSGNIIGDRITNGTTSIEIQTASGNANISVGGTSNVAVFTTTGQNLTGTLSATSNITGGNLLTGGLISATGNITSAANVSGGNVVTGGLISSTGNITSAANITGGNVLTGGLISATGNITSAANISGGNLSVTSNVLATGVSVSGNITGGNVLTGGLVSAFGNITSAANIAGGNVLATTTVSAASHIGSVVSVTANVTGGNILTGGLISSTGNISSAANIAGGNLLATTTVSAASHIGSVVSVTANVTGGNLLTSGNISATGNITGSYFIGNGSQLTGILTGNSFGIVYVSGQSNVVADQATDTLTLIGGTGIALTTDAANDSVTITATTTTSIFATGGDMGSVIDAVTQSQDLGLITDVATPPSYDLGSLVVSGVVLNENIALYTITGNRLANNLIYESTLSVTGNILTSGLISATGNITSAANVSGGNLLTGGLISATGNITSAANISGSYILGNGSQLTGIGTMIFSSQANTPPAAPRNGDFWYDTYADVKYQYINDGDGNAWVDQSFPTSFTTLAANSLTVTANITSGNVLTSGLVSVTGNITSAANIAGGNMLATSNIYINSVVVPTQDQTVAYIFAF